MKLLSSRLLIYFVLLAFALPGFAAAPVVTTAQVHVEDIIECGSFQILSSFTSNITRRTFFDEAGNPARREVHLSLLGTMTNATTGKSVDDRASVNRLFDFQNKQTVQTTGVIFHINVPGKGVVLLEAGKVVEDVNTGDILFKAGPTGSFEDLCAGLA